MRIGHSKCGTDLISFFGEGVIATPPPAEGLALYQRVDGFCQQRLTKSASESAHVSPLKTESRFALVYLSSGIAKNKLSPSPRFGTSRSGLGHLTTPYDFSPSSPPAGQSVPRTALAFGVVLEIAKVFLALVQ